MKRFFSSLLLPGILIICFNTCISFSVADTLTSAVPFRHFVEEDGLKTKTIYSIIQDTEGFIWFSTDAGVFRFDGKTFKRFTVDDGLSDNEILRSYQDRRGRIWFLTLNGNLSFWFKGVIFNKYNAPFLRDASLNANVTKVYEDRTGKLWFGYKTAGLVVINDTVVTKITVLNEQRDYATPNIFEDSTGKVFYFYRDKLVDLDNKDSIQLPENILDFCQPKDKSYGVALFKKGVFKLTSDKKLTNLNLSNFPGINKICNMFLNGNRLWICTLGDGCFLYVNNKFERRFLQNSSVTSVLEDFEGNIWFSTISDGVYMYPKNTDSVNNFNYQSGLSGDKVISIVTDRNKIWVGYNNGYVDRIEGVSKTSFNLRRPDDAKFVRTAALINLDDTIWCGTDLGVYYITNDRSQFVPLCGDKTYRTYAIKQIAIGAKNRMYAGTSLNYFRIDRSGKQSCVKALLDSIVRTFSSIYLGNNNMLVSTQSGLKIFSEGKYLFPFTQDTTLNRLRILDMKFDSDSLLILCSNNNGICILKGNKTIQHITVKEGMSDNNCRKIIVDRNELFVATGNGLSILNKKDGKWFLKRILTMQDGLLSNSINDIAVTSDKLFLATDNGLSIMTRTFRSFPSYHTKVVITELLTDTTHAIGKNEYSFESDIPRLMIRFSYPVFNSMNKSFLKYRLVDQESQKGDWNVTANNEVEFSSLVPGNYLFEIKPDFNNPGVLPASIRISILPKWWQLIITRIFFLLAIAFVIYFISRKIVKSQYERKLVELRHAGIMESERNRIASDMHDDIGADLTQISMWLNILRQKEHKDDVIVQKVSALSNEVLAKIDQIIWALDSKHDNVTDLFSYLHYYMSESVESTNLLLEFSLQENMPEINIKTYMRRNIFLVMKELLHNTIKHSDATKVCVKVSIDRKKITIHYADDGKGFTTTDVSDGFGLNTIRKRMSEINSEFEMLTSPDKGLNFTLIINTDE
jgi:signal transduction histidine kinase/streptogramin lyase